jgi:hypothetical protein
VKSVKSQSKIMFFWLFEFLVMLSLLFTAAEESHTVKERAIVTYLARVGQRTVKNLRWLGPLAPDPILPWCRSKNTQNGR